MYNVRRLRGVTCITESLNEVFVIPGRILSRLSAAIIIALTTSAPRLLNSIRHHCHVVIAKLDAQKANGDAARCRRHCRCANVFQRSPPWRPKNRVSGREPRREFRMGSFLHEAACDLPYGDHAVLVARHDGQSLELIASPHTDCESSSQDQQQWHSGITTRCSRCDDATQM